MADAARPVAQLLRELADNATGEVSPQHMRNLLVTALGVYGTLYCFDENTEQSNIGTSGITLNCFTDIRQCSGVCAFPDTDELVINHAGDYDFAFSVGFSGTFGSYINFRLAKNGAQLNAGIHRKLANADVGAASFIAHGIAAEAGDRFTIMVASDTATDDITVIDAEFSAKMVG